MALSGNPDLRTLAAAKKYHISQPFARDAVVAFLTDLPDGAIARFNSREYIKDSTATGALSAGSHFDPPVDGIRETGHVYTATTRLLLALERGDPGLTDVGAGFQVGGRRFEWTGVETDAALGHPGLKELEAVQGPPGEAGADGRSTLEDWRDAEGDPGLTIYDYIEATKGPQGDPGATGATGAVGPAGATGAAGAKGDKGDKGDVGATGATGPAGATGPTGPQGATGATGATGQRGKVGLVAYETKAAADEARALAQLEAGQTVIVNSDESNGGLKWQYLVVAGSPLTFADKGSLAGGAGVTITQATAPSFAALPGDTPEDAWVPGTYAASGGATIKSQTPFFLVGGYVIPHTTELADGAQVTVRVIVAATGVVDLFEYGPFTVRVPVTGFPTPTLTVSTQSAFADIVEGRTAVNPGEVIGLAPGNYSVVGLTGAASQPQNVTWTSADPNNLAVTDGWRFQGTKAGVTFHGIKFVAPLGTYRPWFAAGNDVNYFLHVSGAAWSDLALTACQFDGSLHPFRASDDPDGITSPPALTANSVEFKNVVGLTIERCRFDRLFTSLFLDACQDVLVRENDFLGRHADCIVIQMREQDARNTIIRDNFIAAPTGFFGRYHADFVQIQPQGSPHFVDVLEVFGNVVTVGTSQRWPQVDPAAARYIGNSKPGDGVNPADPADGKVVADAVLTTADYGNAEIQVDPASAPGGTVNLTLPSCAASTGFMFAIRLVSNGTVNVILDGADTYAGGSLTRTATGDYIGFESPGGSEWKPIREGYREFYRDLRASRAAALGDKRGVVLIDASGGDVDYTLDPTWATGDTVSVMRVDESANTVRALGNGATVTRHGTTGLTEIEFPPGYSVELTKQADGSYALAEDAPSGQILFANGPDAGLWYKRIRVYCNIVLGNPGCFIRLEDNGIPHEEVDVWGNTHLHAIADDLNGDGVVGRYEGATFPNEGIHPRSPDGAVYANTTLADIRQTIHQTPAYANNAWQTGSVAEYEALLASEFGKVRTDLFVADRAAAIAAATPAPGSNLDGSLTHAVAIYDFDAKAIRGGFPDPVLLDTTPVNGGTESKTASIVLTYDQFVKAPAESAGSYAILTGTATVVETFDVVTGAGSNGGTVAINGRSVVITPGAPLAETGHRLTAPTGIVIGRHFGGEVPGIADGDLAWTAINVPSAFTVVRAAGATSTRTTTWGGSQKLLFGCTVSRLASSGTTLKTLFELTGGGGLFRIAVSGAGQLRFNAGSSSQWTTENGLIRIDGTPIQLLVSINTAAATLAEATGLYVGGTRIETFSSNGFVSGQSSPSNAAAKILNGANGILHADLGMLYYAQPATLPDLTDPAVRAEFAPSKIIPGAGANVLGAAPLVFMHGDAAFWNAGNNLGNGGAFTPTGTFSDV